MHHPAYLLPTNHSHSRTHALTPSACSSLQIASSVLLSAAEADSWFQLLHSQLSQSPKNLQRKQHTTQQDG